MARDTDSGHLWLDWLSNALLRSTIAAMLIMPYRWRVPAMGWIMRRVIAPVAGYEARANANLARVHPDWSAAQRRAVARAVIDNAGRTLIENYSTRPFLRRMRRTPISGPGLAALEQGRRDGRPAILVTGHFGNYEAPRAALATRGIPVGGLYRRARNRFFNRHYARTMKAFGGPVFEQGPRGTAGFVRHLRKGGFLVLLFDQHVSEGIALPFLGIPAMTATSAAELALRYDALLVPFYGIRRDNGLDFDIVFEAPVTHSDARTMTRALNASLERRIAEHPGQWFWVHRRWKVPGT